MKAVYTILLLIVSNVFMTFAWYGHLKMKQEYGWFASLPLIGVVAFSWSIAFFEYLFQIPANRIGFIDNGGPFSLMQLKVIQEVMGHADVSTTMNIYAEANPEVTREALEKLAKNMDVF